MLAEGRYRVKWTMGLGYRITPVTADAVRKKPSSPDNSRS